MNTVTTSVPASTNTILAIDLAKYKWVACRVRPEQRRHRFATFEGRSELHRLIDKEQPAVVIIEACLLAGWVHDLCGELGVRCLVARTASDAWKFKHLKRMTSGRDETALRPSRCGPSPVGTAKRSRSSSSSDSMWFSRPRRN